MSGDERELLVLGSEARFMPVGAADGFEPVPDPEITSADVDAAVRSFDATIGRYRGLLDAEIEE